MKRIMMPAWQRVVNTTNCYIVQACGERFPMYIVSEYPKSGGTWLARMAADCLENAFPQRYRLPIAMPCVIHNHWTYSRRLRRPFYLYRDGRDIMVSYYFHRMRRVAVDQHAGDGRNKRLYDRLFGKGYDPEDVRTHLPRFIEHEFKHPRGSRLTWTQHIDNWYDPDSRPHVAYLSYEQLLAEPHATLKRAAEHLAQREIDDWRIDMAVEKFSMAKQTGRKPGQEDRSSFIRKGVAGDWANHFSREAAEIFRDRAGDTLVMLGYEPDHAWVERIGSPVAEPAPIG